MVYKSDIIKKILTKRGYKKTSNRYESAANPYIKIEVKDQTDYFVFSNMANRSKIVECLNCPFNKIELMLDILENLDPDMPIRDSVNYRTLDLYRKLKTEPFLTHQDYRTEIILSTQHIFVNYRNENQNFCFNFHNDGGHQYYIGTTLFEENEIETIKNLYQYIQSKSTKPTKTLRSLELVLEYDKIKRFCDETGCKLNPTRIRTAERHEIRWHLVSNVPSFFVLDYEFCITFNRGLSFLDNIKALLYALKSRKLLKQLFDESKGDV